MQVARVLRVVVDAADAELAADSLWQAGPSAVHEAELPDGRVVLTADVADPAAVGATGATWKAEVVELDPDADLDAWRAWARPVRAGRRFVVRPAWLHPGPDEPDTPEGPDDVVLLIDPGRAFGSGSHPTTRQVLAVLEELPLTGASVLDVGCGSGVLAVGAARLGARGVLAVDVAPEAVEATADNAARNGVAVRVEASTLPVEALRSDFDVVVANIGLRVLVELAGAISARVAPGGDLVLAGLLDHQCGEAVAAYPELVEEHRSSEEGWTCVVLHRPAEVWT